MNKKKHLPEKLKRSERRVRIPGSFIVKREGVDVFWGDLVERSA